MALRKISQFGKAQWKYGRNFHLDKKFRIITVYKYGSAYVDESKSCKVKLKKIVMKIKSVIGINGYTLMVYLRSDRFYGFSVIDKQGKVYTCDSKFSSVDSATLLAISAIKCEM